MHKSWLLAIGLALPALAAEPTPIDEALQRLYDFNFPAAHRILEQCIAANSNDPLPYAFRASAFLFFELDRMGILESEFLIDDKRIAEKKRPLSPDPGIRVQFLKALEEADSRGEAALKVNPDDRAALFALSISQGVATDYMALVEKHQISSLSLAKRSSNYAQRLLKLDPKFYDAYLTAGLSEYMVGSLPFFVRWFVKFDGVAGSKERGKESLELVAREGRYFKAFAKILLGIIDLREKRPQDAQKLLVDLAHDYPANPLFRKELAKLNGRLGLAAN
jgi:tetratricopeptide (TPR) repeat protein